MAELTQEHRRCGCPEQYKGRDCPACRGTGLIPPVTREEWEEQGLENATLIQMMQRIAEDVLSDPVRYDDLTPEMVRDGFIKAWNERGREIEGIRRYLAGEQVCVSTGIHGGATYGYGYIDANGFWEFPVPEALVERGRENEQLKIVEASLESGMRLRQEALDLAEARVEELREAVRLALDALTDAEHYHARACAKDEPHDHPLLRKLRATIPLIDAALAASPAPAPPEVKS